MTARIHPTAVVAPDARIGEDVEIGPYSIVGDECAIGDGCRLGAHVVLERFVTLGRRVRVGVGSVLGSDPQDVKFKGERTTVEVGDDTLIREYVTINRATTQSYKTTVGKGCFLMTYVHLAHDCHVGDGVTIANATQLAGHVTIEEKAILSGLIAVHQFVKIGAFSFVGGSSRIPQDVPPYLKAVGNPVKLYGLNSVGLQRNGFSAEVVRELKRAYRLFFRSELNISQALARVHSEVHMYPEVKRFVDFVETSQRGIVA